MPDQRESPFPAAAELGRRALLQQGLASLGLLVSLSGVGACLDLSPKPLRLRSNIANLGALGEPDENGLRLPQGFKSRLVARSGDPPLPHAPFTWHFRPDGAACVPAGSGGWIYVSNSEVDGPGGGAGCLRFDRDARLIDAYGILQGTARNCAGGSTPWSTWLSCEEVPAGQVWECDPIGGQPAVKRPALGTFKHEAAAVDLETAQIYLTEDEPDGCLYRFTPGGMSAAGVPDLSAGRLEVAEVRNTGPKGVRWIEVPDPAAGSTPTRYQVIQSTAFNRGEGIAYQDRVVYFPTTGDHRVWAYRPKNRRMETIYDREWFSNPELTHPDNVTLSLGGDLIVAEDRGDLQIVAITPDTQVVPLLQITGQSGSEVTGPAFTPLGDRLYFSSQRGTDGRGLTYEIRGPFLTLD